MDHIELPDPLSECFHASVILLENAFVMPADGRIRSFFGWRRDPFTHDSRFHRGVDVANLRSSRIVASAGGRVMHAGPAGGYGLMVTIVHSGGLITRYGHLQRLLVIKGQRVRAGETIGEMGSTGRSTGSHLHFEVWASGQAVDPVDYLVF